MSALGAGRADNLAEKAKICNTCGDTGFDDCLAFCSHCNEGAEHVYCMVTVFDTVPQDWVCEGCKVKQRENNVKRRFVCDGLQPIQAHKKQVLSNSFSAKSTGLLHSSSFKIENGTEHFATIQAPSKASKGPACQVQSMGGATIKEILLAEADQLPFSNMPTKKLGSNNSNERNPAYMVAPDVKEPSHPVIPAKGISAKVSSCSETNKAVSTRRCHNDLKKITHKDLPGVLPKTFTETISTLSNSQSASVVAQVVKEPSCLAEPLESVLIKDTSAIALDMKISGERVGSKEQELNNIVFTSVAKGKPLSVEAEYHNLNKTVAFSSSSLAKPVATTKESMEISFGTGKLEHSNLNKTVGSPLSSLAKPVATEKESMGRTTSVHPTSMAETNSVNADDDIPKHTDILIMRTTSKLQHSQINSTLVKSESMKVASSFPTGKVVPVCRTALICETSMTDRENLSADEDVPKHTDASKEKPTSNPQRAIIYSTSLKSESMKGASSFGTGKVVPALTSPLSERNSVCEDVPNHTIISIERPILKPQHAIVKSTSMKTEFDDLVKRSRLHTPKVATRDFPIITQKIKILGEKGEKISNVKSKEKLPGKAVAPPDVERLSCPLLPGGNVLVKEDTATLQEINSSGNKLQAKEEVSIIGGSNKSFNLFCEEEKEHHQSGGVLVKGTTTGRETDGSRNRFKAKEEENATSDSAERSSLFSKEEKAQPQKGGAASSPSCLISGSAECPSLFSKEVKTQPQDAKQKGGMAGLLSCLTSGSAEPTSLFPKEEKAQPQNVKEKGGAAVSLSGLIKTSGASWSRTSPTHSVPAIEQNAESLVSSPCMMKEPPSCKVLPRHEESMRVVSAAGTDKISGIHLKRVARRDFPPLKAQIKKVGKIVGLSRKETITAKVVTPLQDNEQVTESRSDADTETFTRRDVAAIAPKVLPGKLKNGSSSISMGNLVGVITTLEDDKRFSCPPLPVRGISAKRTVSIGIDNKPCRRRLEVEDEVFESKVSAKHTVSIGIDNKAASRRLEVGDEAFESKESAFPLCSRDTRPEGKECLGNAKQECDATVLSSCVTKELPTNDVSSAIKDEVASMINAVPTNFESASKRKTTKKNFCSRPCKERSSSKRVATLECVKVPPCLPKQMERVTVNDTSNIQLERKEVLGRGQLSRSDGLSIILNNSVEGEPADAIGGRSRQKGEALEAVAASSCQVRSSGNVTLAQGIAMRDASNAHSDKVTFTGKRVPSVEADHDFADIDSLDKVKISPGRHTLRSPCAFNRSASMMDDGDQLSFFEPRLRDSPRRIKAAVLSSIGSMRDRYENATYIERESQDDGFHAMHEDADCEPSDRMGLRKSTSVRPRHYTLPGRDVEFRSSKQFHYSRGSRHQAGDLGSYKGAYRCHRCDEIGHSTEFCKAHRQRERRTTFSPDFDDRDLPDSRSDPGHVKRIFMGSHGSDGRKPWRYHPRREDRFMNSRSQIESNAVDCVQMCSKRPPKVSEHTRFDEEPSYKLHSREEASFERESSRNKISHSLNGMKSELKPFLKQSEYTRVHKRQIVRMQTQDSCKADIAAPELVATGFENGKVFPVQGNASLFPAGPAGALRGGYVNKLLPNQVPLIPQDQVRKDRISQTHVASRLHGSSIRNFTQERRAAPDRQVMWTGCFNVSSKTSWETSTFYQGIQARPSNVANSKVFEALLALPSRLEMEEKKRGVETDSWPRSFQESPPTSHSIGIYFFSTDAESYGKWYKPLLHRLADCDLALKVKLEFAQLLIFPSQLLPEAEQCWENRYFLWGIFKNNKVVGDTSRQPSDRDPGSELGSPTGNGEVIDMDVDMVGGEDAVSREWQEFSPPLPPGFPPAPPYPP